MQRKWQADVHRILMNGDHAHWRLLGPLVIVRDVDVCIIGHLIFKPKSLMLGLSYCRLHAFGPKFRFASLAVFANWTMMFHVGDIVEVIKKF